jgi:hypothetical protein
VSPKSTARVEAGESKKLAARGEDEKVCASDKTCSSVPVAGARSSVVAAGVGWTKSIVGVVDFSGTSSLGLNTATGDEIEFRSVFCLLLGCRWD